MQQVEWDESTSSFRYIEDTFVDLESHFNGLKYLKCEGLNNIGERKVYVEEYSDDDRKRVYIPKEHICNPIEIKLSLLFVGDDRQYIFDKFNTYITDGHHAYWDTARKKRVIFYISKPITPSDDIFKGSTPYIKVTYTLSCVYGRAFNV